MVFLATAVRWLPWVICNLIKIISDGYLYSQYILYHRLFVTTINCLHWAICNLRKIITIGYWLPEQNISQRLFVNPVICLPWDIYIFSKIFSLSHFQPLQNFYPPSFETLQNIYHWLSVTPNIMFTVWCLQPPIKSVSWTIC